MSLIAAVVTSTILAGVALWKKALTTPGTILAWFMCVMITAAGGAEAFLILAATFVLTAAAGKAAGQKSDPLHVRRRTGTRDAASVLCNVGMGTFAMMCMIVSGKDLFLLVYTAVMAESLADSLASKIGPLSKKDPVDICTFMRIAPGLSGGVTLIGTLAEFAGAVVIASIGLAFHHEFSYFTLIALCGAAGAVFDSILGSRIQAKFICPRCGKITEKETHCGISTECVSGFRVITNDIVNILSNIFTFIIATALFCLIS